MGCCFGNDENKISELKMPTVIKKNISINSEYNSTRSRSERFNIIQTNRKPSNLKIEIGNIILDNKCNPLVFYRKESSETIGKGSFGIVDKVIHINKKFIRAMKTITIKKSKNDEINIKNEIDILKKIDHPNIVKLFEYYKNEEIYYLITEYYSGGNLSEKLSTLGKFEESQAAYILFQILCAVYYLHQNGIIHRDLKLDNILIENEEKDTNFFNIKIVDFGISVFFENGNNQKALIGSGFYIAPEVLENKQYYKKCDIWSCGVILYKLITSYFPFNGKDQEALFENIKNEDFNPERIKSNSDQLKDLLKNLLDKNPNSRFNSIQALKHDFFKLHKTREKLFNISKERFSYIISKLKNFKYQNKFQEVVLTFLIHNNLHMKDVKDITIAFCTIDEDYNGAITEKELSKAIKVAFPNYTKEEVEKEVETIFENIDSNKNGKIEYAEFLRAVITKDKLLSDEYLCYAFNLIDKEDHGYITIEEIYSFIKCDREVNDEIEKLFNKMDKDKNGTICKGEFYDMMRQFLDSN